MSDKRFGVVTEVIFVVAIIVLCFVLTACSATSALTGLVGSKPEMSAQVGAENTKQGIGVNNNTDTSSKQETTFKESQVGKVDSSNKKQVSTSSIKADTITADKIEITNNDSDLLPVVAISIGLIILSFIIGFSFGRSKKEP